MGSLNDVVYTSAPDVIDTETLTPPAVSDEFWVNRTNGYYFYEASGAPKCSVIVTGYNRLNKTQYCVECILKYTADIDYELILVDNGSEDGTLEFFQTVPFERKRIVRITKNIGAGYGGRYAIGLARGKYIVTVSNDVYVTKNWLSNLLRCYDSDPSIGLAVPVSSNVSNFQEVNLAFENFDEMQEKAAAFNVSDPSKWEERMRLVTVMLIYTRPVLDIVGTGDAAFVHDFAEDDIAMRMRRSGFKMMLCKDTWVCHDHNFRNMEDKNLMEYQQSLDSGRRVYKEKYHGIDAWDDILNFESTLLAPLDKAVFDAKTLSALVIDGRCGTPVLEIRNRLKHRGCYEEIESYAFTTQAKYYTDLQSVASDVRCDRIDFIQSHYADESFNIIMLGEPINTYNEPVTLLQKLYNFLKPGGVLLFKLRNVNGINAFLMSAGLGGDSDPDLPSQIFTDELTRCISMFGKCNIGVTIELRNISESDKNTIRNLLISLKGSMTQDDMHRLLCKNYLYNVRKE
jgi:GT2 family glycosyltransferase